MVTGASPEEMAAALAMYPMLKDGLVRMRDEAVKLDGTAILTTTTVEAVKSEEQMAAEKKSAEAESKPTASGGVGGLVGGLARRATKAQRSAETARDVHDDHERSAEGDDRRGRGGRRRAGRIPRDEVGATSSVGLGGLTCCAAHPGCGDRPALRALRPREGSRPRPVKSCGAGPALASRASSRGPAMSSGRLHTAARRTSTSRPDSSSTATGHACVNRGRICVARS